MKPLVLNPFSGQPIGPPLYLLRLSVLADMLILATSVLLARP